MTLEETLTGWTGPSSTTEQDKQDRTERMVREAVTTHTPFQGCNLAVCTKGSYPNNTNVRTDSDVGISPEPKPAYLVVRQSFARVSVTMFTDESRSRSSLSDVSTGDEPLSLDYMCSNRPANSIEDRSRRHSGSTAPDVIGNPVNRMTGHYWTDRDTRGDLEFVERVREFADDYGSAEVLVRGCK